jgi:hypothetical protein
MLLYVREGVVTQVGYSTIWLRTLLLLVWLIFFLPDDEKALA